MMPATNEAIETLRVFGIVSVDWSEMVLMVGDGRTVAFNPNDTNNLPA